MGNQRESSGGIRGFFNGITEKLLGVNADMDEYEDDYDEDVEVDNYRDEPVSPVHRTIPQLNAKKPVSNVVSFNRDKMPHNNVEITDPANLEEASNVVDFLLRNIIVTVNLETIDKKEAQRVADFVCGAAYALGAAVRRISNHIFIITPTGTGISGGKKESDGGYELPKMASYR